MVRMQFYKALNNIEPEFYLVAVVFSDKDNVDWHHYEAQSIWEDEVNSTYQHDAQLQSPSTDVGPFTF
jgi:hypothetical protein